MEIKNYLLLARNAAGFINEKVNVKCDLHAAKSMLRLVMEASSSTVRGEIIEGNRDFIGDFRVKPLFYVQRDKNGVYNEGQV